MSRDQKLTFEINGGIDLSRPIRTYFTGKLELDLQDYSALKTHQSALEDFASSLRIGLAIPKANIKTNAQPILIGLLKKAFSTQVKSSLIPNFLFQLLKEEHLRCAVEDRPESIEIAFTSHGPLEKAVDYFLGNLLTQNELQKEQNQRIDCFMHHQQIELSLVSQFTFRNCLLAYAVNESHAGFIGHLLASCEARLSSNLGAYAANIMDTILAGVSSKDVFPFFSFAEECDLYMDLQLGHQTNELRPPGTNKTASERFYASLEAFFKQIVDYFQGLSEDEVKTLAKFTGFLSNESQPVQPVTVKAEMQGLGRMQFLVPFQGFAEFFEFVLFHPRLEDAGLVSRYKEVFLEKVSIETLQAGNKQKAN